MEQANASFLRYRGPPILPSSEVVYVIHPYRITRLFRKGLAPEDLNQRTYDHSPANLRAVLSNVADLGTVLIRSDVTGTGPDYPNCWARSTAFAYGEYLKTIKKQFAAVTETFGIAASLIGADKHTSGEFEERVWAQSWSA
ncbi:MAG: hypothetical protein Q9180_008843 [Flavoplaca navasiana]